MTVALDISPLENEHKLRGTGSYTYNLSRAIQQYKNRVTVKLFTRTQKVPENIDLVHYTYFDPFFLTFPFSHSMPFIVTVHDLIPVWFPKHFPRGIRGGFKWRMQKSRLKHASAIITDSKYAQNRIRETLEYPLEKIHVIPLAPAEIYRKPPSPNVKLKVLQHYNFLKKFILYVGDVNWNKNIPGLLQGFQRVLEKNKDLYLVLVGKSFLNNDIQEVRQINGLLRDFNIESHVIKAGYVPDEELVVFYSLAKAYVQPSFAEGFGLPVLEAMSCGCLTVVSQETSLPEIAGPSIIIDPYDHKSIARGIFSALEQDQTTGSDERKRWAESFRWTIVAEKTIDVYKHVLVGFMLEKRMQT